MIADEATERGGGSNPDLDTATPGSPAWDAARALAGINPYELDERGVMRCVFCDFSLAGRYHRAWLSIVEAVNLHATGAKRPSYPVRAQTPVGLSNGLGPEDAFAPLPSLKSVPPPPVPLPRRAPVQPS